MLKNSRTPDFVLRLEQERLSPPRVWAKPYTDDTNAPHLMAIQARFSPHKLSTRSETTFGRQKGMFLSPNDQREISSYADYLTSWLEKPLPVAPMAGSNPLTPLFNSKVSHKEVAIIVGNGNILSVIPELPDDIILLDIESAVHHFILSTKELILNANSEDNFDALKFKFLSAVDDFNYATGTDGSRENLGRQLELGIDRLGEKHFLSSAKRFKQCRNALQRKNLLPIKIDIFDNTMMAEFSSLLQKENIKISFLNLTNISDYDTNYCLFTNLRNMPFATPCKIISTSLLDICFRRKCFLANSIEELEQKFLQDPHYNGYQAKPEISSWKRFCCLS